MYNISMVIFSNHILMAIIGAGYQISWGKKEL